MNRTLIAGVGNIFRGDDAFGVEVARRMAANGLPPGVVAIDYGVREIDLTYALMDACRSAILVEAVKRGGPPGSLYVIEPKRDPAQANGHACSDDPDTEDPEEFFIHMHDLDPDKVLKLVGALGGCCRRVLLVGCEPADLGEGQAGAMRLSPPVQEAVARAIPLIETLVRRLLDDQQAEAKRRKPGPIGRRRLQ